MNKTILILLVSILVIPNVFALPLLDSFEIYADQSEYEKTTFNTILKTTNTLEDGTYQVKIQFKNQNGILKEETKEISLKSKQNHLIYFDIPYEQMQISSVAITYSQNGEIIETDSFDLSDIKSELQQYDLVSFNEKYVDENYNQMTLPTDPVEMVKYYGEKKELSQGYNLQADSTTINIPLHSMTTNNQYLFQNPQCDAVHAYVESDGDGIETRAVFVAGFFHEFGLKDKTITKAMLYLKFLNENDAGQLGFYASSNKKSGCATCMNWNEAFNSCNINSGSTHLGNFESDDNANVEFTITNNVIEANANQNGNLLAFYVKGEGSNDVSQDIAGKATSFAPYITVTFQNKACTSGPCCTPNGEFQPESVICDDSVGNTDPICLWGNGAGADVGAKELNQFCSGYSNECTGEVKEIGDGYIVQDCAQNEYCSDAQCHPITCSSDADCAPPEFIEEPFCSEQNTVMQKQVTYTCQNPASANSACIAQEQIVETQQCAHTCYQGTCAEGILEPTLSINNQPIWQKSGYFKDPIVIDGFEQQIQEALAACTQEECEITINLNAQSTDLLELSDLKIYYKEIGGISVEPTTQAIGQPITFSIDESVASAKLTIHEPLQDLSQTLGTFEYFSFAPGEIPYELEITYQDGSQETLTGIVNILADFEMEIKTKQDTYDAGDIVTLEQVGPDESDQETMFSDETTTQTLSLSPAVPVTKYFTIPKSAQIETASINLASDYKFKTYATQIVSAHVSDPRDATIHNNILFVTGYESASLVAINISNKDQPIILDSVQHNSHLGGALGVTTKGTHAYVASATGNKITVVDFSNPLALKIVGHVYYPNPIKVIADPNKDVIYAISSSDNIFSSVDVANPASPVIVRDLSSSKIQNPTDIAIKNNKAYVVSGTTYGHLAVVDLTTPTATTVIGSISGSSGFSGILDDGGHIAVTDTTAFVVLPSKNRLSTFDISNPANIEYLTSHTDKTKMIKPRSVVIRDDLVFVASSTSDSIKVFDALNPTQLTQINYIKDTTKLNGAYDIQIGDQMYTTNKDGNSISIIDYTMFDGVQLELAGAPVPLTGKQISFAAQLQEVLQTCPQNNEEDCDISFKLTSSSAKDITYDSIMISYTKPGILGSSITNTLDLPSSFILKMNLQYLFNGNWIDLESQNQEITLDPHASIDLSELFSWDSTDGFSGEHRVTAQITDPQGNQIADFVTGSEFTLQSDNEQLPQLTLVGNPDQTQFANLELQNIPITPEKMVVDWRVKSVSIAPLNMPFEPHPLQDKGTISYSSESINARNYGAQFSSNNGYDGHGAYFFENNAYLQTNYHYAINQKGISVSAWYYTDDTQTSKMTVVGGNNGGRFEVYVSQGYPGCRVFDVGEKSIFTSQQFTQGWHHIVCVQDYANQETRLYVDGVLQNKVSATSVPMGGLWKIGAPGSSTANYFNGYIDDVAIYTRPLSSEQVLNIYQNNPVMASTETNVDDVWNAHLTILKSGDELESISNEVIIEPGDVPQLIASDGIGSTQATLEVINIPFDNYKLDWQVDGSSLSEAHFAFEQNQDPYRITFDHSTNKHTSRVYADYVPKLGIGESAAYQFNGVDDFIVTSLPYYLDTQDLTISAWYFIKEPNTTNMALVGGNAGGRFEVYVSNGKPGCRVWDTSDKSIFADEIYIDGWHHVVCEVDAKKKITNLYVDGELKKSVSAIPTSAGGVWNIGKPGSTLASYYEGLLDDVQFYNHVLGLQQIQHIYNHENKISPSLTTPDQEWQVKIIEYDGSGDIQSIQTNELLIKD